VGADDEVALARFAACVGTQEERGRFSEAMRAHPDFRRWIETVRDVLDARPIIPSAHAPGPAELAPFHERIGRYHDLIERYLRLKLRDTNLADEVFQEFWTRLLTHRIAPADSQTGRFHDTLRTALNRLIIDHFRARKLEPPIPETLLDEATPDADYEVLWREALMRHALWRLKTYEVDTPGNYFHTVLELRQTHPRTPIEDLAAQFSEQVGDCVTPEAFRKMLQGARSRFLKLLIREVRETILSADPEDIKAEIFALGLGHLFRHYGSLDDDDP
jgi:RNA polymerase sigma-70 factor (ECF subfamily)